MKNKFFLLMLTLCTMALFACQIPFINGTSPDNGDNQNQNNQPTTPPSEYTVTFLTNAGYDIDPVTVKPGDFVREPYAPTKQGYRFSYWAYDDIKWNFSTYKVNEDITLVAVYDPIYYTITYDLNGGTCQSELPSTYTIESDTIVLPIPEKEGCTFAGWYRDGTAITEIPKGSTKNISLVADYYGPNAEVMDSQTASVRTWDNGSNIEIKLTDTDDTSLSVKLTLTKPWHTVKVLQGNEYKYVEAYTEGDTQYLDFEMKTNSDNVIITPVIMEGETMLPSTYGIILANGTKIDKNYYPGFVRKSVTFTIDDGNLKMDEKFINIVRPAGIVGTFNLINTTAADAVKYLTLYKGFEVANHHRLHCLPMKDGMDISDYNLKNEIFSSSTADPNYVYITKTPGLYYIDYPYYSTGKPSTDTSRAPYWHPMATDEAYMKYAALTKADIEAVFGEGSVVGFAYPHGVLSESMKEYFKEEGYLYARKTGVLDDKTGFALPADRFAWTYNANATNLNEIMAKYDVLEDDGTLKFFSFGVHASDFDGKWYVLESFARNYGNRPEDFWYASNRDIFEYEDAINALEIHEDRIVNPSDVDVFVTIDNVKTIIFANSTYEFDQQ